VSVDGVQAEAVTDSNGNYVVEDSALASGAVSGPGVAAASTDVELSVLVPGYEPRLVAIQVDKGDRVTLEIVRQSLTPEVTVTSPTGDKVIVIPSDCTNPKVLVEGYAKLSTEESFQLDVVVVIDRSGSTAKDAFDLDGDDDPESVLEVELSATECFLGTLDAGTTRVAIVAFNDNAQQVQAFTGNLTDAIASLDNVPGSGGGTNYEAAFAAVRDLFLDLEAADALDDDSAESPAPEIPDPVRAVVFLSDGIPTSHGIPRDTSDSNLTQSQDDRQAAIDTAFALGEATRAQLYAYSILPANDTNYTRTTLPHCVAACDGGAYENIDDLALLESTLCGRSLVSELSVVLSNTNTGSSVTADLRPDGFYSELIPVSLAAGHDQGDDTVSNTIEVTLTAFSGALQTSATQSVEFRLIDEDDLGGLTDQEVTDTQSALQAVADVANLTRPTGGVLGDNQLHSFLLSEYEDAVELLGVDSFAIPGAGGVTLEVDFVFKEACYQSDFGYFVFDPDDPPTSAAEALAGVTAANILFNSGTLAGCNVQSITAGTQQFSVNAQAGDVVGFFILPNRTLTQYQANPHHRLRPLFTLSHLNPGGFDQVLTFRSEDGRTEVGGNTSVVTAGPLTVLAFEDLAISRRSDQDFSDVVFTVNRVVTRVDSVTCD